MYQIIWAAEHAPIANAEERAILVALAVRGDPDGCNCYRSVATLARAARVSKRTVQRRLKDLTVRGIIREQPWDPPARWQQIPEGKRPVVRELMIPASFWSAAQLDEINEMRAERGRPPITPDERPDLPPPPPIKARADKGKQRKGDEENEDWDVIDATDPWGDYKSPQGWGDYKSPPGVTTSHPWGDYKSPNHLRRPFEENHSSSYLLQDAGAAEVTPVAEEEAAKKTSGRDGRDAPGVPKSDDGAGTPEEGGADVDKSTDERRVAAEALVDNAVARWHSSHRPPRADERQVIITRVAAELAAGGDPDTIREVLADGLHPDSTGCAVAVVMSRTRTPGWGKSHDPRPASRAHVPRGPRPPWCGRCAEDTRHLAVVDPDDPGRPVVVRCPDCHPEAAIDDKKFSAAVESDKGTEMGPEPVSAGLSLGADHHLSGSPNAAPAAPFGVVSRSGLSPEVLSLIRQTRKQLRIRKQS